MVKLYELGGTETISAHAEAVTGADLGKNALSNSFAGIPVVWCSELEGKRFEIVQLWESLPP